MPLVFNVRMVTNVTKNALPLIINAPAGNTDICEWLKHEKVALERVLAKHGAVLYRGFDLIDAKKLGQLVSGLSSQEFVGTEESSPRSQIDGNVYTSTNYRSDQEIFPHNENSYKRSFPMKLFFYCEKPSEVGGETPVVDCRSVLRRLDPSIAKKFLEKKWMYVRNFGNGIGLPWEEAFNTTDRSIVERYCRDEDIQFEWIGTDSLRTRQVRDPVLRHPLTGELSWFNHITFFNIATLDERIRESLLSICDIEDLPHNTYYGDGTPIEASVMEELQRAYRSETVVWKWERGDLIVIDNLLTSHARKSYKGERSIMLAQADPIGRHNLTVSAEQLNDAVVIGDETFEEYI
jgi:hypothetical protein